MSDERSPAPDGAALDDTIEFLGSMGCPPPDSPDDICEKCELIVRLRKLRVAPDMAALMMEAADNLDRACRGMYDRSEVDALIARLRAAEKGGA